MKRHNPKLLIQTRFWQYFTVVTLLTITYFAAAKYAFSTLDLGVEASPLWPPAGIALAVLLLQGWRVWPGVALGAFLFARSLGVSWAIASDAAFGSALQALVGAVLLNQIKFRPSLKRLQDVLQLIVIGAWVSPLIRATFSTLFGYLDGSVKPRHWAVNWCTLWMGDAMGVLLVTPLLLLWSYSIWDLRWLKQGLKFGRLKVKSFKIQPPTDPIPVSLESLNATRSEVQDMLPKREPKTAFPGQYNLRLFFNQAELIVCFTLLCVISWAVFGSKTAMGIAQYPLEYLPFPLVVWAALRFAQRGAVTASLIVCLNAIGGAARGVGPFVDKAGDIYQTILFLHGFMGVVTISALVLAAAESERVRAVDLLKEREASLANAQRLAQLGNWDFYEKCEGKCVPQPQLRWSDELYRLLGFDPKAIKPSWEAFFQVVHPADRDRVGQAIRGALRENKPYCIEYRLVLPDNSQRVVCEQSEIHKGCISGTVQNITQRKQVEAQLRAATERVSEATERHRLLGEMALRIRRSLNLDQILNTTVAEVRQFLGADRVFIGQIDAVAQDCKVGEEWESWLVGKLEGSQQPANLQTLKLKTPLKGLVIAESVDPCYPSLRSMIIDDQITLKEWRSLFAQNCVRVIEDTQASVLSPQIGAYYSQYQVRAILGVPIWVGERLYGALVVNQCDQPRQWQSWEIAWLTSLATQVAIAIQQAELYRQIKDLNSHLESQVEERTRELSAKMTELQELNQLKDVFLQAVSHDLRTSLLGMSMVLNNLYKSSGETITLSRPLLERMVKSSERQLILINSLLEDHFNEERELELHCQSIELDKLIQDIIVDYSPKLTQNKATLTYSPPGDCPAIAADPTQLRRVLENLLTNALTHNPPGVNLTLQITVEDQRIRCALQDDGVGMSKQQQKSLFKLYIRGLHTQHLTGIGLGLYQCRQIINAHGGDIGVISAPGAGTAFWFTLPLAVA